MSKTEDITSPTGDPNTIRPTPVTLNVGPSATYGADTPASDRWQQQRFMLIGIGIGVVLLIAVIFVLPNKVSVQPDQTPAELASVELAPVDQGPAESPWQEQQFGKERRETQEILAKLLDKQQQLDAIQVWVWAEADYDAAKETAVLADADYRQQEFIRAQQGYNTTLAMFNALLDRSLTLYQESLELGEQAIVDGDDKLATAKFELAALIDPGADAPQQGLQRAAVLAQVIEQISLGRQLQRQGQLEQAKQHYVAALDLDLENLLAQTRLKDINSAIRDQNFGKQMSLGYAAINSKRYSQAVKAFEQAVSIKPEANDARNALTQARNQLTQTNIQKFMQTAEQLEQAEQWQTAFDNFNRALALDPNLIDARVGAIRAKARADVDQKLEDLLGAPERLTTAAVHQEFTDYLAKTKTIPSSGPRLNAQLQRLELALQQAVEPVPVRLRSDNLTAVTLYRVGELGLFAEKELSLQPGIYTVVGKRNGYRDVRQEFTVSLDQNPRSVTIQCIEKISKG